MLIVDSCVHLLRARSSSFQRSEFFVDSGGVGMSVMVPDRRDFRAGRRVVASGIAVAGVVYVP
ncbi:hypothetical protein [Rhodococcus sp. T7]|uniref:hypothetical protein n=1 Tax=Rhodococcus sp. T7 TaxID=627444 RepID=UPI00135CC695|nr:hypothetical protein [Rhodococcus sp. T7]